VVDVFGSTLVIFRKRRQKWMESGGKAGGNETRFLRRVEWGGVYENEDRIFVSSSQFRLEPQNFHFMFNAELCNLGS
jgi:hypothetical protein